MKKQGMTVFIAVLCLSLLSNIGCPPIEPPVADTWKQPIHQYNFPIDSGDIKYYTLIGSNCGMISGGPRAAITQEDGALHFQTETVNGASSYVGFWHSVNECAASRHLLMDPSAAMPWPISADCQLKIVSWYARVKGHGNWKVEFKTGPQDNETTVKEWPVNDFDESEYVEIRRDIPPNTEPFKLFNVVAETNSDLYFDEVGFYTELPKMDALRYAFLVSAAQVFRCYGIDNATGLNFVRDRSNWPIGDFDSVPGLGVAAFVGACGSQLDMIKLADAKTLAQNCVKTLLLIPAHESGFLPHWTKVFNGELIRHPDSEISTVDTSLAYLSAYIACAMLGLEDERLQILDRIKRLNFAAVTTADNEISHGFNDADELISNSWTAWGGETQLVMLLAKMNNPAKRYAYQTVPPARPSSPVAHGTGFIMEIMSLFSAQFGGQNVGPDRYGVDWCQMRQEVMADQVTSLPDWMEFIGGQSAVEIVSATGNTLYHVGGTDPLNTGEVGFDSPWVAPHYAAMVAALDIDKAAAGVEQLQKHGLMTPLIGPAESILVDLIPLIGPSGTVKSAQIDFTVRRWNAMQGVLNGFFSAIGYYHAVAEKEFLVTDQVYQTNTDDAELNAAFSSLFDTPPPPPSFQTEDGSGDGQTMSRTNAQGDHTVYMFPGMTRTIDLSLGAPLTATAIVRYSNDNYGNTETVDVAIDSTSVGSFAAEDTGNYGYGWNVFVESPALNPIQLAAGDHVATLTVRQGTGDGYGIELDCIMLESAR